MILLIVNAFKLMGSHFKHIQACSGIIQTYIPVDWQLVVRETQLLIKEPSPFSVPFFFYITIFLFLLSYKPNDKGNRNCKVRSN
jgi:hypothetical protein